MSNWSKVEYIKNLTITVDGGQDSSAIYGNERNCAAVTVSFNGMNDKYDDHYLDLQKENIGSYTYLIDYNTGKNLSWEKLADDTGGLFYSYSRSKFCNSPADSASSRSIVLKRASVTFYVYGKCTLDMKRMIAFKIKLPNGNEVSSTKYDENIYKVDLLIKAPMRYSASDLEPTKWEVVSSSGGSRKQWVAFVKLKSEFNTYWVDHKFETYPTYNGDLVYVSRTTRHGDSGVISYFFYLCPLGKQSLVKLDGNPYEYLDYNQESGALCIVCLKTLTPGFGTIENSTDDGFFRLYDAHGNLGEFKLVFDDPINPTIVTQNIN